MIRRAWNTRGLVEARPLWGGETGLEKKEETFLPLVKPPFSPVRLSARRFGWAAAQTLAPFSTHGRPHHPLGFSSSRSVESLHHGFRPIASRQFVKIGLWAMVASRFGFVFTALVPVRHPKNPLLVDRPYAPSPPLASEMSSSPYGFDRPPRQCPSRGHREFSLPHALVKQAAGGRRSVVNARRVWLQGRGSYVDRHTPLLAGSALCAAQAWHFLLTARSPPVTRADAPDGSHCGKWTM